MTVKVLGPLETGTSPLSPRERAIFTALAVRVGSAMSTAELADACWGENLPATWNSQVKNAIAKIRSRLGSEVIATIGTRYRLTLDPDSVDAVQFERLVSTARFHALRGAHDRAVDAYRRGLALWRGTPYEDASSWEPAVAEAMRLDEIRRSAEEELLEARLTLGEHRAVISDAERLVREEPLREDRWAILALANYRAGRQAEALATLRAARRRLDDELGIDPGEPITKLETAILRQDPALASAPPAAQVSAECPYRGLETFGPEDAALFFGREADIDAITPRIHAGSILAIVGPSGSGKSSLLLAGVIPRVAARGTDVPIVRPGAGGVAGLRSAMRGRADQGLLAIDQTEELFGLSEADQQEYCALLATVLESGGAVVLTVRSDVLDRTIALPHVGTSIGRSVYVLGPMRADALREAIERPAAEAGLRLEPGLVELVLRDAGERSSTLPHLSHALLGTWIRREGATLTIDGYEASGGIAGAIAQSAEDLYRTLPARDQDLCRSLMLRLVYRDEDGLATRHRVMLAPLLDDDDRRRVLNGLVAARLVALDGAYIAIAHEAVATAWPRLDGWLADGAEGARILRQVETSAQAWSAAGRPSEDLLRGARLHAAIEWRASAAPDLTPSEDGFLDASEAAERADVRAREERALRDRSQNRRLRWALAGAAVLLVTAVGGGSTAVWQGNQAAASAENERIEALAATSLSLRGTDRDVAALLAAELHRRWPNDPRARSALLGSVMASGGLISTTTFGDDRQVSGGYIPGTRSVLVVRERLAAHTESPDAVQPIETLVIDLDTGATRQLDVQLPPLGRDQARDVVVSGDGRIASVQSAIQREVDPSSCCANRLDFFLLSTGAALGGSRLLDVRTSGKTVLSHDGSRLYLIHPITGEPMAIDTSTGELTSRVTGSPEDHFDIEGVFNAISLADDSRLLIGAASRIDVYDSETLSLLSTIPAPEGFTEAVALEDGAGGLLIGGRSGLARLDAESGAVLWQRSTQVCWVARLIAERATFICHHGLGQFDERLVSTGETTGAAFTTLSDETTGLGLLAGSREFVTFAHNDRASMWHWRMDGEPAITSPLAAGRIVIDGFGMGGERIVTADFDPAEPGVAGARLIWDVTTDAPVGEPAEDVTWLSDSVVERWTESAGSALVDERTGRHFSVVRVPGDTDDYFVHPGGAGPRAFVIEEHRIVPIDPDTGEVNGAPIGLPGVNLHDYGISFSELASPDRLAVTYFDPSALTTVTAVFDLADGTELARGLIGDVYSVVTAEGDLISASAARLSRSSDTLEPRDAFAKSGASPTFMQTTDDDETLLMSGWDKNVSLFDLRDGRPLGDQIVTGVSHAQWWPAGFISADGQRMVTNSENGVLLWDLAPDRLFEAACRMAGRELTGVEWSTYLGDEAQTPACVDVLG